MESKAKELVRVIKDGEVVDVYHGSFRSFTEEIYKQYKRPFMAEYCLVEVIDTAVFTDVKKRTC